MGLASYSRVDKNGDGKISMPEAKRVLVKQYGDLKDSINQAFVDADKSQDWYVSMREWSFLHAMLSGFAEWTGTRTVRYRCPRQRKYSRGCSRRRPTRSRTRFLTSICPLNRETST